MLGAGRQVGREIAEGEKAEGEIGSSLFSPEARAGALQPRWARVPGSGEGSAAEGPGLGGLSQTVWVSLSREDRSLCVCKR